MVFLKSKKIKELEDRIWELERRVKYHVPSNTMFEEMQRALRDLCNLLGIYQEREPAKLVTKYKVSCNPSKETK